MGACLCIPVDNEVNAPRYIVSVAPDSRSSCIACHLGIVRGSLTVSLLLGKYTGAIAHQYHFDHGMQAASMAPCGRDALPPVFTNMSSLAPSQERKAQVGGQQVVQHWHARREAYCRANLPVSV